MDWICNPAMNNPRGFESFLHLKHFRMKKYLLKILGVILLCGFISKPANLYNKGSTDFSQIPEFTISHTLTAKAVYSACEFYGILHPDIVVAQSILETGYYKSNICKNYNNLFGLYNSYKKDYFKFDYWWESVEAYKTKVQYKLGKDSCSREEYYKFLEELPYATDPNYIFKLKKLVSMY